jgi:hypothetical protein
MNATVTLSTIPPLPVPDYLRDENGRFNPFALDSILMGMDFSLNVMIMMQNHPSEKATYMILVNKTTGERVRIEFPESWQ